MNQKKMLETKNNRREMKNAFDWLTNRKERISHKRMGKLEEMSRETSIIEKKRQKEKNIKEPRDTYKRYFKKKNVTRTIRRTKRVRNKRKIWSKSNRILQINDRHQITYAGSLDNIKQDKY